MTAHTFLFKPGIWQGEGTITLSVSPTVLRFTTQWDVSPAHEGTIDVVHLVHIEDTETPLRNTLRFFNIHKSTFEVELSNEILGTALGKGIIDDTTIAWEFRHHADMDGFELFQKDDTNGYHVRAEYASPDKSHSIIRAHIRPAN